VSAASCLRRIDVAGSAICPGKVIAEETEAAENAIVPENAVMLQAVWLMPARFPRPLLLTIHHLVVDGVSWRDSVTRFGFSLGGHRSRQPPVIEPSPSHSAVGPNDCTGKR